MKKVNKWSIEDVKKIIERVEDMTGEKLDLELNYNPRLKTTLAWCKNYINYQNVRQNGKIVKKINWIRPFCLEFGKVILNVEKYETFEQTVLHEIAHVLQRERSRPFLIGLSRASCLGERNIFPLRVFLSGLRKRNSDRFFAWRFF